MSQPKPPIPRVPDDATYFMVDDAKSAEVPAGASGVGRDEPHGPFNQYQTFPGGLTLELWMIASGLMVAADPWPGQPTPAGVDLARTLINMDCDLKIFRAGEDTGQRARFSGQYGTAPNGKWANYAGQLAAPSYQWTKFDAPLTMEIDTPPGGGAGFQLGATMKFWCGLEHSFPVHYKIFVQGAYRVKS